MTLPKYFSVDVDPGIAGRIEQLYQTNRWAWPSKRALYHDLLRRGLLVLERDMERTRYALAHLYDEPAGERAAASADRGASPSRAMRKIGVIEPPKRRIRGAKA